MLAGGGKDNGRGLARSRVLRHPHEVLNGHSSSISLHTLHLRESGSRIISDVESAEEMQEMLREGCLLHVLDVPGDRKHCSTVAHGLCAIAPGACLLLIPAVCESAEDISVARQHLRIATSLPDIALCLVITKMDLLPPNTQQQWLTSSLDSDVLIHQFILSLLPDLLCSDLRVCRKTSDLERGKLPVFLISAVQHIGLNLLAKYASKLPCTSPTVEVSAEETFFRVLKVYENCHREDDGEGEDASLEGSIKLTPNKSIPQRRISPYLVQFPLCIGKINTADMLCDRDISEVRSSYHVLVEGLLVAGRLVCGQSVLVGPDAEGSFFQGTVLELRLYNVSVLSISAGQFCSADVSIVAKQGADKAIQWRRRQGKYVMSQQRLAKGVRRCTVHVLRDTILDG